MIDLAKEWRILDKTRRKPDSQAHWDKRAESFSFKDAPDAYLTSFIEKAGIVGGERILDMGCGTGSLAVRLANMGCSVIAADFSKGMLDRLITNASERDMLASSVDSDTKEIEGYSLSGEQGVETSLAQAGKITPLRMSWEDDWELFGLKKDSVDIALASRSLITHDLEDSLRKLSDVARARVCVTVSTGFSPRVDMRVIKAMGLKPERHNDALFVFGVVSDLGYEPTVSYIHSHRKKTYTSPDEAYYSLLETRQYITDCDEQLSLAECEANLRSFLSEHLVETVEEGAKRWMLDKSRVVPWAFISWDV